MIKVNETVALCRELSQARGAKQPGRRYGPAPKKPRGPGAGPMGHRVRQESYYAGCNGRLTVRQNRQLRRMFDREIYREMGDPVAADWKPDSKGRPTPRRGAR